MIVAKLEKAGKEYKSGDTTIVALQPTDLEINKGELTLILGPSGSGKTTLLSMIGCVIYPSYGNIYLDGQQVNNLKEDKLSEIRLHKIGFVFQSFNLIQPLNALENVMQPLLLMKLDKKTAREKATEALTKLGIAERMYSLPKNLSGGQQQRVAIARALVTNPSIILCDEPTASLDAKSIGVVMEELKELSKEGKAVIIVTHDHRLKKFADRTIFVSDGRAYDYDPETEDF
ncbi:ABC transporter ATP-binding protein [Ornithobacterium rhinotracheale]|uniref:ABC transporter ATP-binding protein n=1 Tax=Ornithobacterium rhinotracheale TaxID=28251 RepID=UPI00129C92BD|nr:ABC transporter ATP-binding protein [Ornithobacterium rhinotracheale]MRJ07537.1 ABC transporter ATP-binding protein [Ornithobacterium rhinotracheale]UOH78131.1 ABC transporter ATP-binding protein [Ornithobacterium rhinotracheale]